MTIPQNPKIISRLSLMCPSLRKRVYNVSNATYGDVDCILKGEKPADLLIQTPNEV